MMPRSASYKDIKGAFGVVKGPQLISFRQTTTLSSYKTKPNLQVQVKKDTEFYIRSERGNIVKKPPLVHYSRGPFKLG